MRSRHQRRPISASHLEDFLDSAAQTRLSPAAYHCHVRLAMTAAVVARRAWVTGPAGWTLTLKPAAAAEIAAVAAAETAAVAAEAAVGCSTAACTVRSADLAAAESESLAASSTITSILTI